jgi:hypothetical protein
MGSKKNTGSAFKPTLGRAATAVFGAIRSGRTVEGGLDVEEAYAAKIDEWIVLEAEEEKAEEERARRGGYKSRLRHPAPYSVLCLPNNPTVHSSSPCLVFI